MSELTKVRTTNRPDEEIEVGPQELIDLQRQGLIVEDEKPVDPETLKEAQRLLEQQSQTREAAIKKEGK